MLRPGQDYPQFRPGGAPPPMNAPMSAPLNAPMNAPMNIPPPFVPPPIGGRGFVMPYVCGGRFAYPPPPPTPVPSPHLASFLPSLQAQPFVPPLPQSPPVEAPPPPPPPIASPSAPPSPPLSATERIAIVKLAPPQLPAQPSKPTDPEILKNIEGMAEFVVRNGPRYESMARAKHAGDPKFAFLFDNDSGLEAVINRGFYKWKKEVSQLQSEAAAESQSNKDLESDATRSQLTGQRALQSEEVPGSPAMSDMDMEDDLAAPSPKRDSPGLPRMASGVEPLSPELASHFSRVGRSSQQGEVGVVDTPESPLMSGARRQVTSQSLGKVESFSKSKRAQCRLTGDYTGSLIGNYLSDASEDSEDSEPSENLGMTESKSLDQRKEGMVSEQTASAHQVNPNTEAVEDVTLLNKSEAKSSGHGQSAELLQCANGSPSEEARGLKIIDDGDSKVLEPQKSAGGIRREIGLSIQQSDLHRAEGASESPLEEIGSHQSRKRSRSYSRSRSRSFSRSRSRSRSRSHSRSRSRSRSASQSMEDGSKNPSPPRSSLHKELGSELMASSRTSPKDQANGAERDDVELKARGKRGGKGGGYNICLNYARGRCFRGDSCRFQHQGSEKGSDEAGKESEEHGILKLTPLPQNLEGKSAVEVGNDAGHSAEKAGLTKAKRNAGANKKEGSSEEEAAKRLESGVETVVMPPQGSIPSYSVPRDDLVQTSAGGSSPAHEDEGAVPSAPPAEPPHLSEVALSSPLSPLDPSRQAVGNSSHVVQSYGSSGQLYPIGSEVSGFHQHNPSRFSGSSGVMPSLKPTMPMNNAYSNTDQSFGMTFPGGNHAQVHPPSSGIGENSRFQVYPTGSRYDYSDHARNYAPSLSSEYGLSFQAQSGISLAAPPSAFPPPPTGLSSSSAIRQQHDLSTDSIKGYTSFQHGFSSPFSLQTQQHHSLYPPSFPGDSLRHSGFSDVENHAFHGIYPSSSLTLSSQSQSSAPWTMPGPLNNLSSKVLEMPSITGNSSSYSYALTTIPPLPSIIELPGTTKLSTSSDQYDPLADSFEPSLSGGSKITSFNFSKTAEDGKSFGGLSNTLASHLENVSPGFDMGKVDVANMNEATGDPVVGIVENVSPPEDNRDWSPEQPVEAVETKQAQGSSKAKKNNSRGLKLLRSAVADHVKEVLKPTWKEGHMSKDAFKNIVKKAVDKVTAALPPHHIPKSQEKVDQFMSSSRMKIAKLVQGYIDKYQKT